MKIGDDLRRAISDSGLSANALAKEVNLAQSTVSRLLRGEDVKLSVAEKLAAHFGLVLKKDRLKK
jgi:transcriptional regulator with XRE-family HTH domain